jgi:hypothetical protein
MKQRAIYKRIEVIMINEGPILYSTYVKMCGIGTLIFCTSL